MEGIPYTVAVPCKDQARRWPDAERRLYNRVLHGAKLVHYTSDREYFSPQQYFIRDEWIVNHCTELDVLWDGRAEGGTFHTVQFARANHRSFTNHWQAYRDILRYNNRA